MAMTKAWAGMIGDMTAAKLSSKLLDADADCGSIAGVSTTGLTFEGFVVSDALHQEKFVAGEEARILSEGRIWVNVTDEVAVGDKVMVKTASSNAISKAAGTTGTTYTLDGSRVIVANGATGGLALIELHGVSLVKRGS